MKETRFLRRWGLVALNGTGPYLAGREGFGFFRTSTALVRFDPVAGTALTVSGRPYELDGPEDSATALEAALALWNPADDQRVSAVSAAEAVEMIRRNGNRLRTTIESDFFAVRSEIHRVVTLWGTLHGIDPDEVFAQAGASVDDFRTLPDEITKEHLQRAVDVLKIARRLLNEPRPAGGWKR